MPSSCRSPAPTPSSGTSRLRFLASTRPSRPAASLRRPRAGFHRSSPASSVASASSKSDSRRLERAVGFFVEELARNAKFSAFLLPTLVYREAKVWGYTARWDGVRRKLATRTRSTANARLPTLEPSIGESQIKGAKVPGVSLHVLVFSPQGRRIYEGWGGLDLVHAVMVTGSADTGHGSLVQDIDPFRNLDHLREGVALALDAYVPHTLQ